MQESTLRKILSALVDQFGYQEVHKSLDDFSASVTRVEESRRSPKVGSNKSKVKQNAIAFVEALGIDDEGKRKILLVLARKFEKKAFMPNVNNVRAFLELQGQDISHIKSRQQAVSAVFKCLADWETHSLCDMHKRGSYGGPKSLSVIAESIEKMGRQSRP